jgi:uncharacterized HhH-GPD family protein
VAHVGDDSLIDAIADAVERSPDVLVLRVHLARLLFDRGRYAEALMHCGVALTQDPVHGAALQTLERCSVALTTQARWAEVKNGTGNEPPDEPPPTPPRPPGAQHPGDAGGHARHASDREPVATDRNGKINGYTIGDEDPLMRDPLAGSMWANSSRQGMVVNALVDFTETGMDEIDVGSPSFTSEPEANQLVLDDPFAFLLGILFDQNLPTDRAWRTPYDLRQRLGHLDPYRIVDEAMAVRRAIAIPPKLLPFVENMSGWVISVARIVCEEYHGDAAAIWDGNLPAHILQERLARLPGIGPKKAAMAVQMLGRDFGVPIRDLSGSEIAYNVHARRVLLRTGLAQVDELDHVHAVVRDADPTRGAGIGLPAWKIGRTWCRAERQWCDSCPVTDGCPKRINVAADAPVERLRDAGPRPASHRVDDDCA